jgi:hypothetical protein
LIVVVGNVAVFEVAHDLLVAVFETYEQVQGFAPLDPAPLSRGRGRWLGIDLEPFKNDIAVAVSNGLDYPLIEDAVVRLLGISFFNPPAPIPPKARGRMAVGNRSAA